MKKLFFFTILLFTIVSCDNTNYQNGYNNGYSQGKSDGYQNGYSVGQNDGYQKGYNDAMKSRNADVTITDARIKIFNDISFKVFSVIFYIVLIVLLSYALIYSAFINVKDNKEILGKVIFIIIGLGFTYLIFRVLNLSNLIFFKAESVTLVVFTDIVLIVVGYIITWFVTSLLIDDSKINDVIVIIISIFLLFHILFLLTNINTFLLENPFFATCIISVTIGGLVYTGYRILFVTDKRNFKNSLTKPLADNAGEFRK